LGGNGIGGKRVRGMKEEEEEECWIE